MSTPDYTLLVKRIRRIADALCSGVPPTNELVVVLVEAEAAIDHLTRISRYYEAKSAPSSPSRSN